MELWRSWIVLLTWTLGLVWKPVLGQTTQKEATLGQRVVLPCHIDVSDVPSNVQVMWLDKEGMQLSFGTEVYHPDRYRVDHPYPRDWNLEIRSVRTDDAGIYECRINTRPLVNKTVLLVVQVPPRMVNSSRDTTVEVSAEVRLECFAAGSPTPSISWFRYTHTGQRNDLHAEGNYYQIQRVTVSDAGVYECLADNGVKPTTLAKMRVDVLFTPQVTVPHREVSQQLGATTIMTCLILTNPTGTFSWLRNGKKLTSDGKYEPASWTVGEYQYMLALTIHDLALTDYATYQCVAENVYGRSEGDMSIFEFQSGRIRVISAPKDAVVTLRSDILIDCTVSALAVGDSLSWWHQTGDSSTRLFLSHGVEAGDVNLIDADKYEIQGHYNLVVKSAEFNDAGVYVCEITGHGNYTAEVSVLGRVQCTDEELTANDGERVDMKCSLQYGGSADAGWRVDWHRGDSERALASFVEDSDNSVKRSYLFVAKYGRSDGDYSCSVTSRRPPYNDSCTTHLRVSPNHAANKSASCQDKDDVNRSDCGSSEVVVIVLSLLLTASFITFVIIVACLMTRHQRQLAAVRQQRTVEMTPLKNNGANV